MRGRPKGKGKIIISGFLWTSVYPSLLGNGQMFFYWYLQRNVAEESTNSLTDNMKNKFSLKIFARQIKICSFHIISSDLVLK